MSFILITSSQEYFHVFGSVIIFSSLKRLFEEPETRAVTQDKPYAGKTQNSSALNALTSDPLLSFVERESCVLAVMRLGLWFIWRERHVNREIDSGSIRGDSSLQKDNNSWKRGTRNQYSRSALEHDVLWHSIIPKSCIPLIHPGYNRTHSC